MIKIPLEFIGLVDLIRQAYQHYVLFGKLQNENAYWQRRREEELLEKDM